MSNKVDMNKLVKYIKRCAAQMYPDMTVEIFQNPDIYGYNLHATQGGYLCQTFITIEELKESPAPANYIEKCLYKMHEKLAIAMAGKGGTAMKHFWDAPLNTEKPEIKPEKPSWWKSSKPEINSLAEMYAVSKEDPAPVQKTAWQLKKEMDEKGKASTVSMYGWTEKYQEEFKNLIDANLFKDSPMLKYLKSKSPTPSQGPKVQGNFIYDTFNTPIAGTSQGITTFKYVTWDILNPTTDGANSSIEGESNIKENGKK